MAVGLGHSSEPFSGVAEQPHEESTCVIAWDTAGSRGWVRQAIEQASRDEQSRSEQASEAGSGAALRSCELAPEFPHHRGAKRQCADGNAEEQDAWRFWHRRAPTC
jgi:hypothetical protein